MVGVILTHEMTKNPLCQEKSTFKDLFKMENFGLGKENKSVRISLVSDSTLRRRFRA